MPFGYGFDNFQIVRFSRDFTDHAPDAVRPSRDQGLFLNPLFHPTQVLF